MSNRDFVIARLSGARSNLLVARESIDAALMMFVEPEEDVGGKQRAELFDDALLSCHAAAAGLQAAAVAMSEMPGEELAIAEDDVVGDGDDDGDEGDDEDDD